MRTWPICSSPAWIMCGMANLKLGKGHYLWIVALCTASVLCSLAGHLTADVAGAPPELAGLLAQGHAARAGSSGGEHTTMCELLEEIALLAIVVAVTLPLLTLLSSGFKPALLDWVLPPPVRPPTVIY